MESKRLSITDIDLLYFFAFDLYIAHTMLNLSLIPRYLGVGGLINKVIPLTIIFLLMLKMIVCRGIYTNQLQMCIICMVFASIPLIHGYTQPVIALLLIISSDGIQKGKVFSRVQFGIIFWFLIVFICCKAGKIPDYVYNRNRNNEVLLVHSYGFMYYSTLGYAAMSLLIIHMIKKNDPCSWKEILILLVLNYLAYQVHTTVLSYYAFYIYIIMYILIIKVRIINIRNHTKRFERLVVLLPWIACLFTVLIVYLYRSSSIASIINSKLFNGNQLIARLNYSSIAIDKYGFKLFGSKVEMFGQTAYTFGGAPSAFYIDSGYMYSLIANGIIFTIFLLMIYSYLLKTLLNQGEPQQFLYLVLIVLISVINNFLLNIIFNPLLITYGIALLEINYNDTIEVNTNE